jgi:hypothetical protein
MNYNGHETRYSDSSFFDEICVNCGTTDAPGGGLNEACPNPVGQGGITVKEYYARRERMFANREKENKA